MKILINTTNLDRGGAQHVASIWTKMLIEKGQEVYLLTDYTSEHEYYLDSKVIRYNVAYSKKEYLEMSLFRRLKEKRKILEKINPNIIIPFVWYNGISMVIANKNSDCIVYFTERNNPYKIPTNLPLRVVRNIFVNKNKYLILQNNEQNRYYRSSRLEKYIVGNPIEPISQRYQKDTYKRIENIVAVGRLAKQKNYKFMIETIKILKKNNKNITLSIYGEGPRRIKLLKMIEDNDLGENIFLKGNITNIIEIEKNYDAFLMTSLYEGFPNALLEAMSVGLPVFVTNFKMGVEELVDNGITGIIDFKCKPKNMAKLINENNNEELLRMIGTTAKKTVNQKYSYQEISKQLCQLITCSRNYKR